MTPVSAAQARRPVAMPDVVGPPREGWVLHVEGMTVDVAGMPHILRSACALRAAGVTRVVVVGGTLDLTEIARDPRLAGTTLESVSSPPIGSPGDAILVARGDRVFHRDGPRLLAATQEGAARVVGDWDALVVTSRGRAQDLVAAGFDATLARWRMEGDVAAVDPPFLGFAVPLDDPRRERLLVLSLRKPVDGVISRLVNRHVSLWLTRMLMRTRLRPNHISAFTLLLGLAAAGICALGGFRNALLGAVLLELGSILDGVDGELARLKYLGSRMGEWLDTVSDDIANGTWILGTAANLAAGGVAWAWPLAAVGMACFVFYQLATYVKLVRSGSGDMLTISWNVVGRSGVMPFLYLLVKRDLFVTVFLVLIALGRLDAVLLLSVAGTVGVALAVGSEMVVRARSRLGWR